MRAALILTAALPALLGLAGAASAQNVAAVWQQIRDGIYGQCMKTAQFGAGTELQANCSCSADVAMSMLSDDFKRALADGTHAGFKGPKMKGDAAQFNAALVEDCPKLAPYLQ